MNSARVGKKEEGWGGAIPDPPSFFRRQRKAVALATPTRARATNNELPGC